MEAGAERATEQLDPVHDFDLLYERFRLPLYRTIRGIVLDAATAEDLTQETFERAYRSRHNYRGGTSVGAWLHRIAVHAAISHLRRQKVARLVMPRLYMPASSAQEQVEDRSLAERALRSLSPKLRAVVVLSFYARLSRQEIARVLDIPAGTVASRLGAAMEAMRAELADTNPRGSLESR